MGSIDCGYQTKRDTVLLMGGAQDDVFQVGDRIACAALPVKRLG